MHDKAVHTTANHPWLTTDRGFVSVAQLQVGERVVREDGTPAMIVALRVVRGEADYYNLEVAHLHTFAVGTGKYVVHNCGNEAYARQLANGIRDNINERLAGRTIQPFRVAVGFVREGDSMITVVSANRNFFRYVRGAEDLLRDAASEVLPESNRVIRRASTLIGRGHAEDYIAQFVRGGRGARRLLAISPSDGFDPTFPGAVGPCSYCRGMLSRLVRTGR